MAELRPWTLWGFTPDGSTTRTPIAVTSGSLRHCNAEQKRREAAGWTCAVYASGDEPTGLRLQAGVLHYGDFSDGSGSSIHKGAREKCSAPGCGR